MDKKVTVSIDEIEVKLNRGKDYDLVQMLWKFIMGA